MIPPVLLYVCFVLQLYPSTSADGDHYNNAVSALTIAMVSTIVPHITSGTKRELLCIYSYVFDYEYCRTVKCKIVVRFSN